MLNIVTHIPIVIFQNIGLMAFLYLMFLFIKQFTNSTPSVLFNWAFVFYCIGTLHFITTLAYLTSSHASLHSAYQTAYFDLHFGITLDFLPIVGILYLIAMLFFVIKLFYNYAQLEQYKSKLILNHTQDWNDILMINNMPHVKIILSNTISSPMTIGWWEPIILLPLTITTQLSPTAIKTIILHELAHIIRNDYLIQIIIEVAHSVLFFNPFSYLFKKELQIAREMACDDWVIAQTQEPLVYSKILYQLASTQKNSSPKMSLKLFDDQNELLERIKQINKLPIHSFRNWAIKSLVAVVSIFVVIFSFFIPTEKNHHKQEQLVLTHPTTNTQHKITTSSFVNPTLLAARIPKKQLIHNNNQYKKELAAKSIQEKEFDAVVSETLHWLQSRDNNKRFASYNTLEDSLALRVAEKLVISSVFTNYQLKKEILNKKLEKITDEKEASDVLMNSKEWNDIKQYEEWAKIYLSKHPELIKSDSLANKF